MRKGIIAFAAAVSLLAFGATAAGAATTYKPNATPACGAQCTDIYSLVLGRHTIINAYVPGDTGVGGQSGQLVNLHFASNSHPNEDFTLAADGTVNQFCGIQLATTSVACLHYRTDGAYELDWTPYGNQTDLCVGTAGPLYAGKNVTLQRCGTYEGTLFIGDSAHVSGAYIPLIDGADTSFSHPFVLTADPGSGRPTNQLKVEPENTLTGGTVRDSQLFGGLTGPAA
jgi:hypothetical protein